MAFGGRKMVPKDCFQKNFNFMNKKKAQQTQLEELKEELKQIEDTEQD